MKEYRSLPQAPYEGGDSLSPARRYEVEDDDEAIDEFEHGHKELHTPQWLTYLCYLAILVSMYSLATMTRVRFKARPTCKNIRDLRRPTLYPGLERLIRNESSPGW